MRVLSNNAQLTAYLDAVDIKLNSSHCKGNKLHKLFTKMPKASMPKIPCSLARSEGHKQLWGTVGPRGMKKLNGQVKEIVDYGHIPKMIAGMIELTTAWVSFESKLPPHSYHPSHGKQVNHSPRHVEAL